MEENNSFLDCLYAVLSFRLLLTKAARLYVYSIVIVKQSFAKRVTKVGDKKLPEGSYTP